MNELILITQPIRASSASGRKYLEEAIKKKKQVLSRLIGKIEILKMDLEMTKHTYDMRIGRLYLKDNQLDLHIIQLQNILDLMRTGLSYGDAITRIEDTFYAEQIRLDREEEEMEKEEKLFGKEDTLSEQNKLDIKSLWKKIIRKFHPDLVMDPLLKKEREVIVKQINKAYREMDYETLRLFEQRHEGQDIREFTQEKLEEILIGLENTIVQMQKRYSQLCQSPWYGWKKRIDKAKKNNEDIFEKMEKEIQASIAIKADTITNLKRKIGRNDIVI